MNRLLATARLIITEALDPHAYLRQVAADKNLILTGAGSNWMVLTGDGQIVTESDNPVDAVGQLVNY